MGRRRTKDPKKNALCLRLTEKQLSILQIYAGIKDFENEVDALRHIINGLGDWLKTHDEEEQSAEEIKSSGTLVPQTAD